MSINYTDENTIIFTLARMNPPTPGHLYIIRSLIEEAIKKNVNNVYVILSKTNDNNENPIPCEEKINVLGSINDISKTMINSEKQKMIEEVNDPELKSKIQSINVHSMCVPDIKGATPFTPLYNIINSKNNIPDINLFLIIGEDRKNMLDSITDFFLKKIPNINSVDGIVTHREEMSQYKEMSKDPTKIDSLNMGEVLKNNGMSASLVRNIVRHNRLDKFTELYEPFLDNSKINELFQAIKSGIETLPVNKKKDTSVPSSLKYNYPMLKSSLLYETSERPTKRRKITGGKKSKSKKSRNKKLKSKKSRNNKLKSKKLKSKKLKI
jgi:hypothetical protein